MGRLKRDHHPKYQIAFEPEGKSYIFNFVNGKFTKESLILLDQLANINNGSVNKSEACNDKSNNDEPNPMSPNSYTNDKIDPYDVEFYNMLTEDFYGK